MFSQWATKRACKFVLKRLLGRILVGEVYLENLDVQLASGTIQLKNLALNTDYINDQLGGLSFVLREGSVGSVIVKIPWKVLVAEPCEVELDNLELVVTPRDVIPAGEAVTLDTSSGADFAQRGLEPFGEEVDTNGSAEGGGFSYSGVDDGVRMIARMVEKILLGLCVKVRNLVVLIGESTDSSLPHVRPSKKHREVQPSCCMLVFHVANLEYGYDRESQNALPADGSVDPSGVIKVVKFAGMTAKFTSMAFEDFTEFSCDCPTILQGENDGASGNVKVAIPWRTELTNVPKVEVGITISPLKLRVSLTEFDLLLSLFQSYAKSRVNVGIPAMGKRNVRSPAQSTLLNHDNSASTSNAFGLMKSTKDFQDFDTSSINKDMKRSDFSASSSAPLLPVTRFIPDWVQSTGSDNITDLEVAEADLAASVDEFFDCIDGTRSSLASGSGVWNWTRSVFGVITAASSPEDKFVSGFSDLTRNVEYRVQTKMEMLSVVFICHQNIDNGENHEVPDVKDDLQEELFELCLEELNSFLQVAEHETQFNVTIKGLELLENMFSADHRNHKKHSCTKDAHLTRLATHTLLMSMDKVLTPFPSPLFYMKGSDDPFAGCSKDYDDSMKVARGVTLLRISSVEDCAVCVTVDCSSSSSSSGKCTSEGIKANHIDFSATMQPVLMWIDMRSVKTMKEIISEVDALVSSCVKVKSCLDYSEKTRIEGDNLPASSHVNAKCFLSCVRVFLSFPLDDFKTSECICLRKEFLVLDVISHVSSSNNLVPFSMYNYSDRLHCGRQVIDTKRLIFNVHDVKVSLLSEGGSGILTMSPKFSCEKVLQISPRYQEPLAVSKADHCEDSSKLEVKWQHKVGMAPWILKKAWDEVAAQKRRGDGGGGVGESSSEYAAATASEPDGEEKYHLQEQILQTSSMCIILSVADLKICIPDACHILLTELVEQLLKALSIDKNGTNFHTSPHIEVVNSRASTRPKPIAAQISISVICDAFELIIYPKSASGFEMTGQIFKEKSRCLDTLRFKFQSMQALVGLSLGGELGATYVRLHHEDCQFSALSSNVTQKHELSLMSCRGDVVGRGDGQGANALATGAAGLTVTAIIWPTEEHAATLVTGTLKGATLVAHGGWLDWLLAVKAYFTECKDHLTLQLTKSMLACSPSGKDASENENLNLGGVSAHTHLLLDLHDIAICYVPEIDIFTSQCPDLGNEPPSSDANLSATDSSTIHNELALSPGPVACVLAVAALRVSNNAVSSSESVEFDIKLRDIALHLLDTGLRKPVFCDYTPKSMQNAGYVQVANEAVMKAFVRVSVKDEPGWEVECVNNQLLFNTCQDTTAAFGRLIAQLQQLFTPEIPEIQQSNVHLRNHDRACTKEGLENQFNGTGGFAVINSQQQSACEHVADGTSGLAGGAYFSVFDGVLENAYNQMHASSTAAGPSKLHPGSNTAGLQLQLDSNPRCSNLLDGFEELDGSELTSTGITLCKSAASEKHINDTLLFIEDYCTTERQSNGRTEPARLSPRADKGRGSPHRQKLEMDGVWYTDEPFELLDNHISDKLIHTHTRELRGSVDPNHQSLGGRAAVNPSSKNCPGAIGRVLLRGLNARWKLYVGSDWPLCSPSITTTSKHAKQKRQQESCVEVILDGMDLQYDAFPDKGIYASKLFVAICDVKVYDCSFDAPWRLVLGYYRSSLHPRETFSKAVRLEMESVRPNPESPLEEYRLYLSLLPIRLDLDQRHIDFFTEFFAQGTSLASGQSRTRTNETCVSGSTCGSTDSEITDEALLPFFQICEIRPFTIRIDYLPRRLNLTALRAGNYAELLNLVSWKGIELQLKQVRSSGVRGWGDLSGVVIGDWLQDISQNQVHNLIKGLGPIRPFYALGSGAAKLIVIPAKQYRKDRRLLRGMKKGAIAFFRSISLEALGLGAHLAAGAHQILQQTELALGGLCDPEFVALESWEDLHSKASQPIDTREGLQQAYESISRSLERTASSLLSNPLKMYQRGAGAGLAVVSVLKAAPAAALAPASAAAGAVHQALLGVRNGLDPEHKRDAEEKHAGPPPEVKRCK